MAATMKLPVMPPVKPMLAKAVKGLDALPDVDLVFEPKWDGFRCIVFRDGDEVVLGSRNERPLTRYFPELLEPMRDQLPDKVVVDGELVIATDDGLDFDALQQRIHPAESRVNRLAAETPASFVAFDMLALGNRDLRDVPLRERRRLLEQGLGDLESPLHLTRVTSDRSVAADWFVRFEGAGLDGLIAKPLDGTYLPDKRAQFKVKHQRTADCVVAGFRMHKSGDGVGSLLLGLFDEDENLNHVGVATSFTAARRKELFDEIDPLRTPSMDGHPWKEWYDAEAHAASDGRMPGAPSRWNAKKDLSWEPLKASRVIEVAYEHMQGNRFRHATRMLRWRDDKTPAECTYEQLETVAPYELASILGA
jgi:ATP-dependent DNA ligase